MKLSHKQRDNDDTKAISKAHANRRCLRLGQAEADARLHLLKPLLPHGWLPCILGGDGDAQSFFKVGCCPVAS
jgi:hypothetical protein